MSSRSIREAHLRHVTTFVGVDFARVARERAEQEKQLTTKAEILALLGEDGEAWGDYLDGISEETLAEVLAFPPGAEPPAKSRFELLLSAKEHEMHHRAQLMVIERMLGIVPHLTRQRRARAAQSQAEGR